MKLWLVGQYIGECEVGRSWSFQGVFSTRELAVAACRTPMYSIQTVIVDEEIPHEMQDFPDGEYPLS